MAIPYFVIVPYNFINPFQRETKCPKRNVHSQDKPAVRELYNALKDEGWIDPWLDKAKILPGQDWRTVIEKAVEKSDVVIVCLSTQSVSKEGFVQREIKYAYDIALEKPEETIFLIPLRLDECTVPRGLRSFHWVDYFGLEKSDAYSNLLDALQLRYEQKLTLEDEERVRQEKERFEREAAEIAAQEQLEREKAEKLAQEKIKFETAQKARGEQIEREAVEKATREKAKRDATAEARRERAERKAAQLAAVKEALSKSFNSLPSLIPKMKPFLGFAGIIGIVFAMMWFGLWEKSQNFSTVPTASLKPLQVSTLALSSSPAPLTKTIVPSATSIKLVTPSPTTLPTEITDTKGVIMGLVPAGTFMMGSDRFNNEKPPLEVTLDNFYMDVYEVVNALYIKCQDDGMCTNLGNSGSYSRSWFYFWEPRYKNYPVIYVDWFQANKFCEWRGARLPTEAEWEKAARGSNGRSCPWGEDINHTFANYGSSTGDTTEVGKYKNGGSPYGMYDMAGNVWEWVSSLYKDYPYNANDGREDLTASGFRVIRGGSWNNQDKYLSSSTRQESTPFGRNYNLGFRCARDAAP